MNRIEREHARLTQYLFKRFARAAIGTVAGLAVAAVVRRLLRYSFRDRVVLITGGSRGLGLMLARVLGREGARLMLLARDKEELTRAALELRGQGIVVEVFSGDVMETETADLAVAAAISAFGRLDVLINNAGTIIVGPLENMAEEDYQRALATHFWAPLRLMTASLPHLKKGRGRIVNICSVGGKIAVPHLAPYSASKFALAGLSDAFRAELAKSHISVTTVYPGLMRTGSHIQAVFKGQREQEFGWFSLGCATPLTSISAYRAARQIAEAARARKRHLVLSIQARLAVLANALFPNATAVAIALADRLLPAPGPAGTSLPGHRVRGTFPPRWMTAMADRASVENNEGPY